jgi:hypothetical protein
MRVTVATTTSSANQNPFELAKRAYPETVELAGILRRYLYDSKGHWHGHKLVMAIAIARDRFDAEHYQGVGR